MITKVNISFNYIRISTQKCNLLFKISKILIEIDREIFLSGSIISEIKLFFQIYKDFDSDESDLDEPSEEAPKDKTENILQNDDEEAFKAQ